MSDFLDALLQRTLSEKPSIRPRLPAIFEPDAVGTPPGLEQLQDIPAVMANASLVNAVAGDEEGGRKQPTANPASQVGGVQPVTAAQRSVEPGTPLQAAAIQAAAIQPGSTTPASIQRVEQPYRQSEDDPLQLQSKPSLQAPGSVPQVSSSVQEAQPSSLPATVAPIPGTLISPADRSALPVNAQLIPAEESRSKLSESGSLPAPQPAARLAHNPEISTAVVVPVGLASPESEKSGLPVPIQVEQTAAPVNIPASPAAPRVTIHIGRIEIRMARQPAPASVRKPALAQRKPVMSLDSYLKQRSGEKS